MSWLRSSPLRASFSKQRSRDSPPKDADPSACYNSFCKHWQQAYEIILNTLPPKGLPSQDNVLGVVNHVDHMVTLLMLELREPNSYSNYRQPSAATHSPCLEYLLSENLLLKLYDWGVHTGRYNNAVRLEQLKLYELLVSHNGSLLAHEPVTRPLLWLLEECSRDIMPVEVEKKLVVLLNQLCVALMQNMALLDLFFQPGAAGQDKFIIFSLLIPHVHREGGVGQQARDAMLLCMSLSKKNDGVGEYIAEHSNICPVLATGLSGLYSLLSRKLNIETDDWHRLTPDDVNDLPSLTQLMNSLEFCNAIAQVAHPLVQQQLLEFLYRGFLVPVMGPALLQTTVEELIAATAYFDLFLRSVTDPGLLRSLIRFLLEDNYDECRILDSLIQRISCRSRLCVVTLALFETLVSLNCEDVMLELCLGALSPCTHVMFSQRKRLKDTDPFGRAAEKFLSLTPNCCSVHPSTPYQFNSLPTTVTSERPRTSEALKSLPVSISCGAKTLDSLYGNYYAYLSDARQKIRACRAACSSWSYQYDGRVSDVNDVESLRPGAAVDSIRNEALPEKLRTFEETHEVMEESFSKEYDASSINGDTTTSIHSSYASKNLVINDSIESTNLCEEIQNESFLERQIKLDADIAELLNEDIGSSGGFEEKESSRKEVESNAEGSSAMNSLLSIGDSSGYESFAFRKSAESTLINDFKSDRTNDYGVTEVEPTRESISFLQTSTDCSSVPEELTFFNQRNEDSGQDLFSGQPNVGIFLDVLLRKLECMMTNNLYVNLHLTGLISRLAIYPQPLLQSFLLNHSLVFQPSVRSLFQVLASVKHKIDLFLSKQKNVDILVEQARLFLIGRENKLVNARKNALEATVQTVAVKRNSYTGDPFSRGEPKRWSLTSSFTQILRRSNTSIGPTSLMNSGSQLFSPMQDQSGSVRQNLNHRQGKAGWESTSEITPLQNAVLSAVILDEWLKELAAITQEHAIMSLSKSLSIQA